MTYPTSTAAMTLEPLPMMSSSSDINHSQIISHFLCTKMVSLSGSMQSTLKVASCFGMTIGNNVVQCLSDTPQFASFSQDIEQAARDGFMTVAMDSSSAVRGYKFIYQQVRDAAYGLIQEEERHNFHFLLGTLLYEISRAQEYAEDLILEIADQIKHGNPSSMAMLECPLQRVEIAELTSKAGCHAMDSELDFKGAYQYLNAAAELLPERHWESHYQLSHCVFLRLGFAAHACGNIVEANDALNAVLKEGLCLEDKLDAYACKVSLLRGHQDMRGAYQLCLEVLSQLGEVISDSFEPSEFRQIAERMRSTLQALKYDQLLLMKEMDSKLPFSIMQFYSQLCSMSYFIQPHMTQYFASKMIYLTLQYGVCKYSPTAFAAAGSKLANDIEDGYRAGEMALLLLSRFNAADQIPIVYLSHYAHAAIQIDPLRKCASMLKRGFEVGIQVGDFETALLNGNHYIQKAILGGENLDSLQSESQYQMQLIGIYQHSPLKMQMSLLQETISLLSNKDVDSIKNDSLPNIASDDAMENEEFTKLMIFHKTMRAFWLGHYERCIYYTEKALAFTTSMEKFDHFMIMFYRAIAICRSRKGTKRIYVAQNTTASIESLKNIAQHLQVNCLNKIILLEAEFNSRQYQNCQALKAYDTAILLSQESQFIHEQGLACELAGLHCSRLGQNESARKYLFQAKECYAAWGSQNNFNYVCRQIAMLN